MLSNNYIRNYGLKKSPIDPNFITYNFNEEQDIELFSMYLTQISS